ncbi:head decoration protein [Bradyrhizobium tropiciagri]|uniref:head decoration protein n=1 Tax=Bradyrhizobium tropiciagri TaxID=312253 RepID=UPI001BA662B9|nr:head decoration protein [Bradyrhizobium tropiciagri]MBR0871193.1 head decoration protein [Bradyrhizobium tropiciagri]
MLTTFKATEPRIETNVLKYVVDNVISKGQDILAAGSGSDNVTDFGTVLGKITLGALDAAYAARAGNTGNFTNAFANPKVAPGSKLGVYTVTFVAATRFRVEDPDGIELGEGTTGVAFTNALKFTITAGGTPAAVGDAADITVTAAAGSAKVVPINFAATDGSQNAYAIALAKKVAKDGGADQPILTLKRLAAIDPNYLIWPAGATDNQKAAALDQLEKKHIIQLP